MDINATLLVECLFFLSFVVITMKYIWPPIQAILDERQNMIRLGLERARAAEEELSNAQLEALTIRDQARKEAQKSLKESEREALLLLQEAKLKADKVAADVKERARLDIQKEKLEAMGSLKEQVTGLAFAMLNKILKDKPELSESSLLHLLEQKAKEE